MRRCLLAALLLVAACRDWRERVEPGRASAAPEQEAIAGEPEVVLERKGFRVTLRSRASYRVSGYVVETSRKLLDRWDFVMPLDLALIWGTAADPAVLRHVRFHLSERYLSYRYDASTPAGAAAALPTHVANNHLIPSTDEVARDLAEVRVGDLVTLTGKLVDVEIRDPGGKLAARMRTSLARDDVGSGACEILWVEAAHVERPD